MRERRGPRRDVDLDIEREPRMPDKWKEVGPPSLNDVRAAWESIFCPACGKEHPDTSRVRIRRTGQDYEARCLKCGAVIAYYVDGFWSA
jgi:RNase P subunit RPR2